MDHTNHASGLATEPQSHPIAFAAAFNTGDPIALDRVYEPDAVLVSRDGTAVTGAERRSANSALQSLGIPIGVIVREVHQHAEKIALLIVDWEIVGRTPSGDHIDVRGTATDVARRGPDGLWRYIVDNPFGVAARH